jgi:polyhydroxybutyrate depolymerase
MVLAVLLAACAANHATAPPAASALPAASVLPAASAPPRFRLRACTEAPVRLPGPPGPQSRGCVVTFRQRLSDPASVRAVGATEVERRYLVYAPAVLPARPAPVVLVFPGYTASAEAAAFYYTHMRFEELADRDGFVVVYGNGLPNLPPGVREKPTLPKGGFLQGCFAEHEGEGIDVSYVRRIIDQLAAEVAIDRTRIYATGLSAGGGMAFELALEAPDLVAAIAPVAALPFQPTGPWRFGCHPRPGHERVSIAMLAATDDPFISYAPGNSREYPAARYPGMEQTRDAWLAALAISGEPEVDALPDLVQGDSYEPETGRASSRIERQRYRPGPDGRELWYYKAVGMGHAWPNPTQTWGGLWRRFGKSNQDIDFADEAWAFFRRHARR